MSASTCDRPSRARACVGSSEPQATAASRRRLPKCPRYVSIRVSGRLNGSEKLGFFSAIRCQTSAPCASPSLLETCFSRISLTTSRYATTSFAFSHVRSSVQRSSRRRPQMEREVRRYVVEDVLLDEEHRVDEIRGQPEHRAALVAVAEAEIVREQRAVARDLGEHLDRSLRRFAPGRGRARAPVGRRDRLGGGRRRLLGRRVVRRRRLSPAEAPRRRRTRRDSARRSCAQRRSPHRAASAPSPRPARRDTRADGPGGCAGSSRGRRRRRRAARASRGRCYPASGRARAGSCPDSVPTCRRRGRPAARSSSPSSAPAPSGEHLARDRDPDCAGPGGRAARTASCRPSRRARSGPRAPRSPCEPGTPRGARGQPDPSTPARSRFDRRSRRRLHAPG